MLRHDAEGGHVGKLADIGRGQRQRNRHFIVGKLVGSVFRFCGLAIPVCLGDEIGAAVRIVIFERKENVRSRDRLTVRPRHARLDGVGPCDGIRGLVGSQQRMVIALRILPDERKLAHTAGKHIEVIFAECRRLNGSRRADRELLDGICESLRFRRLLGLAGLLRLVFGLCRLLRLGFRLAARGERKNQAQTEQNYKKFFHLGFSFV